MNKKIISGIFKIVVSLLILSILIYKLDYHLVIKNLEVFPLLGILFLILDYLVTVTFNSASLFILLGNTHRVLRFREFLKINWYSFSLGQFSPGRSGELSIVYFLKKKINLSMGRTLAAFIIFKISTLLILLFFTAVALRIYFYNFGVGMRMAMVELILGVLAILILVCFAMYHKFTKSIIKKYILKKYAPLLIGFSKALKFLSKRKRLIVAVFVINITKLTYNAFTVVAIGYLLNQKFPLILVLGINAVIILSSLIPISFSGIGIKESLAIFLFSLMGFSAVIIASIYLIYTATYLILNMIVSIYSIHIGQKAKLANASSFEK